VGELSDDDVRAGMQRFAWYHTIELRPGITTAGQYDHAPLLDHYGIPDDLTGKTVLDVGPAHGFFAFEFERRGAERVVTVELPRWSDHDGSGELKEHFARTTIDVANDPYLHDALAFAIEARGSKVEQRFASIYDVTRADLGTFDLVFCASVLLHITDPLRALYALREVTGGMAIVATMLDRSRRTPRNRALAAFHGTPDGQVFWVPNRACLTAWTAAAGFGRTEWAGDFSLPSVDGEFDTPHGVVRAFP